MDQRLPGFGSYQLFPVSEHHDKRLHRGDYSYGHCDDVLDRLINNLTPKELDLERLPQWHPIGLDRVYFLEVDEGFAPGWTVAPYSGNGRRRL